MTHVCFLFSGELTVARVKQARRENGPLLGDSILNSACGIIRKESPKVSFACEDPNTLVFELFGGPKATIKLGSWAARGVLEVWWRFGGCCLPC